jgi:hypothetical protein
MAQLDEILKKIPQPVLVISVLACALALIIYLNPLQDGCDVQMKNFGQDVRGILEGYKVKKKLTQFAQIESFKSLCRDGNSQGACENYYLALKKITDGLRLIDNQCVSKLTESYETLPKVIQNAIQIMALNAWGEKPPLGAAQRLGWLSEGDIYTFCRLKSQMIRLMSNEEYILLRAKTYAEFPADWPDSIAESQRSELPRPRALRSISNPGGSLTSKEIFQRSLFSLRCDLYL